MKSLLATFVILVSAAAASAQSLKPQSPYPLKAGINQGTSDSLVGVHYWYFYAMPGTSRIRVRLRTATTLYGAAQNSTLTITVRDANGGQLTKTVDGSPNRREATFTAPKVAKRIKIVVSVAPPNQNLLRMGGDYEIEATGDVSFGDAESALDPIVRTFEAKTGYNSYGAVKFFANGTLETSTGYRGTWKVFDSENRIYTVTMNDKFKTTVQYIPGYGLVKPSEPNLIEFQELRR
jgi:hypothetical protein